MGNVNPKAQPNHELYLRTLGAMSPAQRARKFFELSAQTKRLFKHGLRRRFPDLRDVEFNALFLDRLSKCHNRNY